MLPNKDKTFFTDGFNRGGTNSVLKFEPGYAPNASWYIHLRGSSRYYADFNSNRIKKFPSDYEARQNRLFPDEDSNMLKFVPQIILSYFDFKRFQIISNSFLANQLSKFNEIIKTIDILYILGYSGNDIHINESIKNNLSKSASIKIVVHNRSSHSDKKEVFWRNIFSEYKVVVEPCDNVLDYKFE